MIKRFLVFFLLFVSVYSFGQTQTTTRKVEFDSLWVVWQDKTQADTTRLNAIGLYSWHKFVFSQPDSAIYYADVQHKLAKELGYKRFVAFALSTKGTAFWVKGDYIESLDFFEKNLETRKEVGNIGGIAAAYNKLGIVYGSLGDDIKEIEYYEKSLKIREQIGDQPAIATVLSNIGGLYQDQGNNTKALEYHERCLKIREDSQNQAKIAWTLAHIGEIYMDFGDYDKAFECYTKSLKLGEEFGDNKEIAWYLENMGDFYLAKSDYDRALDYYHRSMRLLVIMDAQPDISGLLISIGKLHLIQKQYSQSVEKCKESYDIAININNIQWQKEACECLYKGYKGLKNNNLALNYFEKTSILSDSLKSEEIAKKLQQMEFAKTMLNDSIAKAEEARLISVAHQEEVRKKNQIRNISIGIGVLILFLAMLLYNRLKYVRKSKATLQVEKDRSENLLLNILPKEIAQELKDKGKAEARDFDRVSILFTDFKSFTQASAKLSAQELVTEINTCFEAFDEIIGKHGIEKIKTIGDAYMAAGGLPITSNESTKNTILAALDMQAFITNRIAEKKAKNEIHFEMRLGVHTGPIVAGIVGVKKFQYDIWGDTVNIASRMESSSEVGKVNISQSTYDLIKNDPQFAFQTRGKIHAKGKGDMEMYFVQRQ